MPDNKKAMHKVMSTVDNLYGDYSHDYQFFTLATSNNPIDLRDICEGREGGIIIIIIAIKTLNFGVHVPL